MKKIFLSIIIISFSNFLLGQHDFNEKTKLPNETRTDKNNKSLSEDEYGLVVAMGGVNGSGGEGGYALFGNPDGSHINIDNNEIQAKNSQTTFGTLYLNYWGGHINMGTAATHTGTFNALNTLYVNGSTDRIGIDEDTPEAKLHVSANSNAAAPHLLLNETETNDYARLKMKSNSSTDYWDLAGATGTTDKFNIYYNNGTIGSNILTVDGNIKTIGINNDAPQSDLHILHENGFANHGLRIESSFSPNAADWTIYADASTVNKRLFFIPDGSNSPDAHIEHGTGNWVPTSDKNMKKNIEYISNTISDIMKLKPTKYHMIEKENKSEKTYGLIAQDVKKIFPGIVKYIEESDQYGLSYTELIPVLIAGMQEQQLTIRKLESELNAYNELEQRIRAIESSGK